MAALIEGVDYTQNGAGEYVFPATAVALGDVTIRYQVDTATSWQSALDQLGLSLATGLVGQAAWSWLQTFAPTQALAYSGMAYVYANGYPLTNQAEIENHSFEVATGCQVGGGVVDAWPSDVVTDFLTNPHYGAGWKTSRLAALTNFIAYTKARQLWISPVMDEQRPARDWLQGLAEICNAEWTWQGSVLDLVPRGDEAITSAYATFTPDTTPVFDLVHGEGGDILAPVEVEPVVNEDAKNIIRIEWTNRANGYNIETMEARDAAHIEQFGERPADVVAMHAIHDAAVAQGVCQQLLQRQMTVWNTYRFDVPYTRCLMGLMNLATLTDADSALSRVPVRITSRGEKGNLVYTYEAEDAPVGAASAPLYGTQAGAGFSHDYNASPGDVAAPVLFEAPVERTTTGLEVYAAVSGTNPLWGGCRVWASLDGTQYKEVGLVYGGARYGQLTGTISSTDSSVSVALAGLGGQMLSGTAADAAALNTLCWVDGASDGGEYLSYQGATLTGLNAYTLGSLVRSAYRTTAQQHLANAKFVRVDNAIASSGPLDEALIGSTISFKFTSFNVYMGGEQSLADVAAYTYTITGGMAKLPPPDVANFTITGDLLRWDETDRALAPELAGYVVEFNYGSNTDVGVAAKLHTGGFVTEAQFPLINRPSGPITFFVRGIDKTGTLSRNPAVIITDLGDAPIANVVWSEDFKAEGFPGTLSGCSVSGGNLVATALDRFFGDDPTAAFFSGGDSAPFFDASSYGTLQYTTGVINITAALAGSLMTLEHTTSGGGALSIEYRLTGPDPFFGPAGDFFFGASGDPFFGSAGPWLAWPGQVLARNTGYQFRITIGYGSTQGTVSALTLTVDAPDLVEKVNNVAIDASGTAIPYTYAFGAIYNVQATLQANTSGGETVEIDKTDPLHPVARVFNSSHTAVSGASVDFTLTGIGS